MSGLDIERIRRAFPGREVRYFETLDSTMRAGAECEPPAVVLAGEQSAGQGRYGRSWHSEPGAGIYCTIVLRPAPVMTLALGLATQAAILEATGLACDLRWPNDVLLGGKKISGILVQTAGDKAVSGIGINVNHVQFPPELERNATSLRIHTGRTFAREEIVVALVKAVDRFAALDKETVLRLFTKSSSYAAGRRVTAPTPEGVIEGVTAGLDASGFLVVRKDDGTDTLIVTGGVRAAGS